MCGITMKFYKKGGMEENRAWWGQLWMAELTLLHIMISVRCEIPLGMVQKLKITFWRYRWKQVCFWNYILDNTLDIGTPSGDNDFDHKNDDDDNNNNNSDDNNDDK